MGPPGSVGRREPRRGAGWLKTRLLTLAAGSLAPRAVLFFPWSQAYDLGRARRVIVDLRALVCRSPQVAPLIWLAPRSAYAHAPTLTVCWCASAAGPTLAMHEPQGMLLARIVIFKA